MIIWFCNYICVCGCLFICILKQMSNIPMFDYCKHAEFLAEIGIETIQSLSYFRTKWYDLPPHSCSSSPFTQSGLPSHFQRFGIQLPSGHKNSSLEHSEVQLYSSVRLKQSSCPSHFRLISIHVDILPVLQRNSFSLQFQVSKKTFGANICKNINIQCKSNEAYLSRGVESNHELKYLTDANSFTA